MSNNAGNDAANQGATQATQVMKLTTRLAAVMAVALMSGVVATAHADNNDRKHDLRGWSGGKHAERNGRDHARSERHTRSDRRGNQQRNWNGDDRRDRWVNRDHGVRDRYVRDRHWGRDRWNVPRYDYSDYRRHPYYRSQQRYHIGSYYRPHGYYHYAWHRGDRLPRAYYAPRYVVYDYGRYGLYRPPHGHHWVRVDGDVVLAAIATGVVMQVVNQIFW